MSKRDRKSANSNYNMLYYKKLKGVNVKSVIFICILFSVSVNAQTQFQSAIEVTGADEGNSIVQTTDGGYCVCGYTNSFGSGLFDFYIVKLDANGSMQWNKIIGGTGTDAANCIIQTSDGGYAFA